MKPYKVIEEASHGETYQHPKDTFTVYEISVYGRESVLEGQQRRTFIDHYEGGTREENLAAAQREHPDAQLSGSTFQEPSLAHLPDEDGSDPYGDAQEAYDDGY